MILNPLKYAAELLESVLAGKSPADAALKAWPFEYNNKYRVLAKSWTCLSHYADDEDLHEVDINYFRAEQEKLRKCIDNLLSEIRKDDNCQ